MIDIELHGKRLKENITVQIDSILFISCRYCILDSLSSDFGVLSTWKKKFTWKDVDHVAKNMDVRWELVWVLNFNKPNWIINLFLLTYVDHKWETSAIFNANDFRLFVTFWKLIQKTLE